MSGAAVSDPVTIELGEERAAPVVARPPSPRRRRLAGLLVAATAALLAGPPTPAPAFTEIRIAADSAEIIDVDDDRLFATLIEGSQAETHDRTITAYRLPDGERLWQVTVSVAGGVPSLRRFGGVVVLQSQDVEDGEITAIDDESGTILWRRPAAFFLGAPAAPGTQQPSALIGTVGTDTGPLLQPDAVSVVDLRTGTQRWSYRLPQDATVEFAWNEELSLATRMVTGLRSGRVEVRDLATGQVTGAATLSGPVTSSSADAGSWLITHDGLVLVFAGADRHVVSAYGIDRLDHRWTARVDYAVGGLYGRTSCGELLCLGAGDSEVLAIERDTGQVRWSGSWEWVQRVGPALLSRPAHGAGDASSSMALLDPATGRNRYDLGTWDMLSWFNLGDRPMLLRRDDSRQRAWFGVLDPATPGIRLLGTIPGAPADCRGGRGAVVCRGMDGTIGIWRYR
ncbi:MAG TPA: PQQ-binding-like beta-propeller repeat protein [Pilimelia sp.]|nr:PQQ-binding-like beta-propeller repeat protein [Pilimelia sp.]